LGQTTRFSTALRGPPVRPSICEPHAVPRDGDGRLRRGRAHDSAGRKGRCRPPANRNERAETKAIEKQHRINEQIRISPVRVIGADGAQLGIIPTDQALDLARDAGLDLVEVAPGEKPPVCRIMDFGKFKYQQKKKHSKSHVHQARIKEIRLRPKTGDHDIEFKVNQARGFLLHKDKVIVSVVFRGREMAHIDEGQRVMRMIVEQLDAVSKVEAPPQQMGRRLVCTLTPK
jgi:translation initiation factor IF-3